MTKKMLTTLYFLAALTCSCAWWSSSGQKLATDIFDCAEQAVMAKVGSLSGQIVAQLDKAPITWEPSLLAMAASFGWDALACAALAVYNDLLAKSQVAAREGKVALASNHAAKAMFLGKFLGARNFKFTLKAAAAR